jgi:hypothetical protein
VNLARGGGGVTAIRTVGFVAPFGSIAFITAQLLAVLAPLFLLFVQYENLKHVRGELAS